MCGHTTTILLEHLCFQQGPADAGAPGIYHIAGTRDELCKLRTMVLNDIWANEPGLSATDQLFVRACVRTDLLDWFLELDPVSEETGLDEKGGTD